MLKKQISKNKQIIIDCKKGELFLEYVIFFYIMFETFLRFLKKTVRI